jgi:hypothetical protein
MLGTQIETAIGDVPVADRVQDLGIHVAEQAFIG